MHERHCVVSRDISRFPVALIIHSMFALHLDVLVARDNKESRCFTLVCAHCPLIACREIADVDGLTESRVD